MSASSASKQVTGRPSVQTAEHHVLQCVFSSPAGCSHWSVGIPEDVRVCTGQLADGASFSSSVSGLAGLHCVFRVTTLYSNAQQLHVGPCPKLCCAPTVQHSTTPSDWVHCRQHKADCMRALLPRISCDYTRQRSQNCCRGSINCGSAILDHDLYDCTLLACEPLDISASFLQLILRLGQLLRTAAAWLLQQ